ncbi:uncharacterized protein N7496_008890 [Penicillium cataractarum]|uniref:Uncharacterized protein n=1 Tax=Penicillium cataractarum TaxID=2100454 RepID=A0A9W9V7C7_9EURO|nr:uncharacterized protein N7496_008890 [Penicillium cataractarum]KAJ5369130.1 hypothetical protein N7496_008890 [Penicillium cataractarum]
MASKYRTELGFQSRNTPNMYEELQRDYEARKHRPGQPRDVNLTNENFLLEAPGRIPGPTGFVQ